MQNRRTRRRFIQSGFTLPSQTGSLRKTAFWKVLAKLLCGQRYTPGKQHSAFQPESLWLILQAFCCAMSNGYWPAQELSQEMTIKQSCYSWRLFPKLLCKTDILKLISGFAGCIVLSWGFLPSFSCSFEVEKHALTCRLYIVFKVKINTMDSFMSSLDVYFCSLPSQTTLPLWP